MQSPYGTRDGFTGFEHNSFGKGTACNRMQEATRLALTHLGWRASENCATEIVAHRACSYYALRLFTSGLAQRHYGGSFEQMENSASNEHTSNCNSSDGDTVWLVTGANRGMGFAYVSQVRH